MNLLAFDQITQLVHREVVPATGCTEPICVSLAVAYASSLLSNPPRTISVALSANMLKNAMGVGIPGTGMIGLPIAIALGAIVAQPCRQLELLDNLSREQLEQAKKMVSDGIISMKLEDAPDTDKLYVSVTIEDQLGHTAVATIRGMHTNITQLELDGISQLESPDFGCAETLSASSHCQTEGELTFALVYEYATTAPLETISFIYDAAVQNKAASLYGQHNNCGHNLGRLINSPRGQAIFGQGPLTYMLAQTTSACDARMDGAPITVMSNSGSGNQGITATLPVLSYAEMEQIDHERTTRALMMSSLLVIYVKQHLGRLSALCGMVVSGVGVAAAITYLMGGSREQSAYAIKNMIGNLTGMICDGAKPSCSLKASSGISSAMIAALLAMEDEVITDVEGIVSNCVDQSIRNMATIGCDGMASTDRKVLEVMTHKQPN